MPNFAKCLLEMSTSGLEYFWAYSNFTRILVAAYLPSLSSKNPEKHSESQMHLITSLHGR